MQVGVGISDPVVRGNGAHFVVVTSVHLFHVFCLPFSYFNLFLIMTYQVYR